MDKCLILLRLVQDLSHVFNSKIDLQVEVPMVPLKDLATKITIFNVAVNLRVLYKLLGVFAAFSSLVQRRIRSTTSLIVVLALPGSQSYLVKMVLTIRRIWIKNRLSLLY